MMSFNSQILMDLPLDHALDRLFVFKHRRQTMAWLLFFKGRCEMSWPAWIGILGMSKGRIHSKKMHGWNLSRCLMINFPDKKKARGHRIPRERKAQNLSHTNSLSCNRLAFANFRARSIIYIIFLLLIMWIDWNTRR